MKIVVKKFGGTSVDTEEKRSAILTLVKEDIKNGKIPILVISAMGRAGQPYSTDTLIELYKNINPNLVKRDLDLLISCGEIISATLISAYLNNFNINSIPLTGFQAGIITDDDFGDANVIEINTNYVKQILKDGIVPVISGFQGINRNGEITTLGRGGSDTTAALIGEAFKAERVEIITDVAGVYTADPKIVENATVLDSMTYDEMYELSKQGAKVVDFKAVDIAKRSNITLLVKGNSNKMKGTTIKNEIVSGNVLTSITKADNLIQYKINSLPKEISTQMLLDELQNKNISIDMINFFENSKYFIIVKDLELILDELLNKMAVEFQKKDNCSKVTIIGHKIHGVPGIMKRVVKAIEQENIRILQTSDSHMTISCLVDEQNSNQAVKSLHSEFNMI